MGATVQIHSEEAGGVVRTIIVEQTGPDTGHIDITSSNAPGSTESHDVKNVMADPASLILTCQVDAFFSADIAVVVQRAVGGKPPVATITVSHAIFGNGVFTYPLRTGEDNLFHAFLLQARFPPLSAGEA